MEFKNWETFVAMYSEPSMKSIMFASEIISATCSSFSAGTHVTSEARSNVHGSTFSQSFSSTGLHSIR